MSEIIAQELRAMQGEVCPRCGGEIRPYRRVGFGYGGSTLVWVCINKDCDQFEIRKSNTQITVGYNKEG